MLGVPYAQQNYVSSNYTHAGRDMLARGVNAVLGWSRTQRRASASAATPT
jgi:hypothetical protein